MVAGRGGTTQSTQHSRSARYDNRFGNTRYETVGSAARKPAPIQNHPQPRQPRRRPKAKQGLSVGVRLMVTFLVVAAFALSCVMITRQSEIVLKGKQISTLKEDIRQAEKLTEDLKLDLASATDINMVMRVASEEMGMGYPEEQQMRSFTLPRPAQSAAQGDVQSAALTKESEKSASWFNTILGLLQ